MSSNRTPFAFKTMFFIADALSVAVIPMSLYCYFFEVREGSGYAIDGMSTTIVIIAAIFGFVANQVNKQECKRMHSEG